MADKQVEAIELQIARIKQLSFNINENLYSKNVEGMGYVLAIKHHLDLEKSFFYLTLKVILQYGDKGEPVVESEIQNVFLIKDLKKYVDTEKDMLSMPDVAFSTMMTLSISHARALVASSLGGTPFAGFLLPIMNGVDIAKQHFKLQPSENS